ncbi:protein trichome berefringence-like 7 [Macadamia integrifolia]|uniref:protein trichome berefringence-like 7 n=1 Tax=Macadamia integrifolia TaxID=60698 RepID=UPI001C4E3537|nr:protein trichome berefringence-like 7 [Macadamia integrifolia]
MLFFRAMMIEMVKSFSRSTSGHFSRRSVSFGSPRIMSRKSWPAPSFHVFVLIIFSLFFIIVMGCGYHYVFPSIRKAIHGPERGVGVSNFESTNSTGTCDYFDGKWVQDYSYPLYNSSECPFAERGFNCLANGRKDRDYLQWRWKPKNCVIPRFDVHKMLEMLRGKRVVFVGDSMSRTQWESLICLLMTGVNDKKSVYEINGSKITKQIRFLGVRFSSFNFTIEFFRSVFLVQRGWVPKYGPKRVRSTLKLDKLDDINKEWINSDVLIFNTGQWWNHGKLFDTGCYFQVGGSLKLGMPITAAFRTALQTWASWVETRINTNRTRVFFRTFEPSHWSDQVHRHCKVTRHPMLETKRKDQNPFSHIVSEVVKNMTVPVTILHVTTMGAFRSDAHVGPWNDNPSISDCSHWCLPGVPDVWNEIVFSFLFADIVLPLQ